MPDPLDMQIQAYKAMLPELRSRHGRVWALIAGQKLVATFGDFAAAARFSAENLSSEQVLIRHTDEADEIVPFVRIEA